MWPRHSTSVRTMIAVLAGVLPSLAGCSSILDTSRDIADAARVVVDGSSPVRLTLVTSTEYVGARDPDTGSFDITLLSSDTAAVDVPIDRSFSLDQNGRFLVRLIHPDLQSTASVRMRVFLDEELVYDVSADMSDAYLEYVFVYF